MGESQPSWWISPETTSSTASLCPNWTLRSHGQPLLAPNSARGTLVEWSLAGGSSSKSEWGGGGERREGAMGGGVVSTCFWGVGLLFAGVMVYPWG